MSLKDTPEEELQAELLRRAKAREDAFNQPPKELVPFDFTVVVATARREVKDMCEEKRGEDKNFRAYLYEAVMEAIYGKAWWKWKNTRPYGDRS